MDVNETEIESQNSAPVESESHQVVSEQKVETSNEKRFSQTEIDEILAKRLAREKEEREALEQNYRQLQAQQEELINHMRSFGQPKEQPQQQPVFDPTRPITFEDLENMRAAQLEQEKIQRNNEKIELAKKEIENFEETVMQSKLVQAMTNPSVAQQYVGISEAIDRMDDPARFLYYAQKDYAQDLNSLLDVKDPIEQIKALARLEDKIKAAAKVPSVSGAPGIIHDDAESSYGNGFSGDVQAARKRLLGK